MFKILTCSVCIIIMWATVWTGHSGVYNDKPEMQQVLTCLHKGNVQSLPTARSLHRAYTTRDGTFSFCAFYLTRDSILNSIVMNASL